MNFRFDYKKRLEYKRLCLDLFYMSRYRCNSRSGLMLQIIKCEKGFIMLDKVKEGASKMAQDAKDKKLLKNKKFTIIAEAYQLCVKFNFKSMLKRFTQLPEDTPVYDENANVVIEEDGLNLMRCLHWKIILFLLS